MVYGMIDGLPGCVARPTKNKFCNIISCQTIILRLGQVFFEELVLHVKESEIKMATSRQHSVILLADCKLYSMSGIPTDTSNSFDHWFFKKMAIPGRFFFISVLFFKQFLLNMGQSRPLFLFIFVLFSFQLQFQQYKWKIHRWCTYLGFKPRSTGW